MVLTEALRKLAADRPHLLLMDAPGGVTARLAVERWARERGWPLVVTPADADLLVVAGSATLTEAYVDRVWEQLPGPRCLIRLDGADDVPAALEQGRFALTDLAAQRTDAQRREERPRPSATDPHAGHDMSGMAKGAADPHAGHDMSPPDPHAGHDMSGMAKGAADPHAGHDMSPPDPHAGHDMSPPDPHGGHDMSGLAKGAADPHAGHDMEGMPMPAGLATANRAEDRDGLKLDVLTVPLGPVLAWWPAGLVVTVALQGDVVQQARVELLGDADERRTAWAAALGHLSPSSAVAVVRLDSLVRLLALAGWDGARLSCQHLRDTLLTGLPAEQLGPRARRLVRRISRSRALARMTVGIPTTQGEDLTTRYRRWGTEIVASLDHGSLPPTADEPHASHQLPGLLTGTELASARLVVAGLDLALSGADVRVGASG